MTPAEFARIEEALQDGARSYRSIARDYGVSDWLVRKIARELDGDPRPMKRRRSRSPEAPAEETSPVIGWLVLGGIVVGVAFVIWAGARCGPVAVAGLSHSSISSIRLQKGDAMKHSSPNKPKSTHGNGGVPETTANFSFGSGHSYADNSEYASKESHVRHSRDRLRTWPRIRRSRPLGGHGETG